MTIELREHEATQQASLAGLPQLRFVDGPALKLCGVERHYTFANRYLIPHHGKSLFQERSPFLRQPAGCFMA